MSNFIQITPFMHVDDLEKAVAFFIDVLGFRALNHAGDYAYLHRETAGIRILRNSGTDGAPPGNRRFAYYVDVRDVDALYAELKPKLDTLPKGDVHGPADKPYGQRELLVLAPDGNLIAFGQAIERR
jgi:catechol 2,3-dioxygenase-like lactoylglutathione lyase family enzyme